MHPMLSKIKADNTIAITELMQTPSPLCLLFEWLTDYGFSSAMIQQIAAHLDAQTGRFWQSATHELCIDRGRLLLSPIEPSFPEMRIPEPGVYVIQHHLKFRVSLQDQPTVVRRSDCACLDASKVKFPLTIRAAKKGDRFVPFGMKGSRLVSDFLTDQKVPLPEKRKQLVVTDADEHILWIVNRRPAAPCCVSADTQQTLLLKMEEQDAL
jgi:tRNA(Ile)-lysidine synthase